MSALRRILKHFASDKKEKNLPESDKTVEPPALPHADSSTELSSIDEASQHPYLVVTEPKWEKPTQSCPGAPFYEHNGNRRSSRRQSRPLSSEYHFYQDELRSPGFGYGHGPARMEAHSSNHELNKLRAKYRYHKEMASVYKTENEQLRRALSQLSVRLEKENESKRWLADTFEKTKEENLQLRQTLSAAGAGEVLYDPYSNQQVTPHVGRSNAIPFAATSGYPPLALNEDTEPDEVVDFRQRRLDADESFELPRCDPDAEHTKSHDSTAVSEDNGTRLENDERPESAVSIGEDC